MLWATFLSSPTISNKSSRHWLHILKTVVPPHSAHHHGLINQKQRAKNLSASGS